jgi:hypothetical protein
MSRQMKLFSLLCVLTGVFMVPALAQVKPKPKTVLADSKYSKASSLLRDSLLKDFHHPPESAKPWVFWYWMQAGVTREGITADLEAMKQAGIGGAYLMPIKGAANPPLITPVVEQLSPLWWEMVRHAFNEADRLGIKIAMHDCDGFATAGGPWITPELSMQKVVWTETTIRGSRRFNDTLSKPKAYQGYYKDIAILAFPAPDGEDQTTQTVVPKVTTSKSGVDAQFLVSDNNKEKFRSEDPCWIRYAFNQPFTCRSLTIKTEGRNYFPNRLSIEVSDDGEHFRSLVRLQPPRHGWQDNDADVTHSIPATTARFFRFQYSPEGAEPGAEDLDAAKWKPSLVLRGIELSGAPRLHQYEGKNGSVWRISHRTTLEQVPDTVCVPLDKIVNLTDKVDANGHLVWEVPSGSWTIVRMGHTSTGQTNYIGGKGLGLECDKFNPEAIKLQFDKWFGEAVRQAGPELASRVLKIFHVDSWECGSQNWSPVFRDEFKKRRGYDLFPYLLAMTGIPVQSADVSERFLSDVRQTIAELVADNFYSVMAKLAHEKGVTFTAESVAPTMTSDGLQHFNYVDVPMGEFWLRSPTHDKPNDMLDAISGAHIYGKPIVQSEAFTELFMAWDEYPGMLKALGDRNYALGVNRFVFHVFTHNPWMDRKPGMTLGRTGLYFQRDQTWWKPGRAWVEYTQRCQALLQKGRPVADVAVFTGEETPRRSVLPDRLVPVLPGIFGQEVVESEKKRLANEGQPLREMPEKIWSSANAAIAENWMTDPLHGYAYDSYNKDALLRLAKVRNGRLELPGGASYGLLVLPGTLAMSPQGNLMSPEVAERVQQLAEEGATVLINERPEHTPGLQHYPSGDNSIKQAADKLLGTGNTQASAHSASVIQAGKGKVIKGPYTASSFDALGIERDVIATDAQNQWAKGIAWTHRTAPELDIYFLSNQLDSVQAIELSLRVAGRVPELWDPLTGEVREAKDWKIEKGRTVLPLHMEGSGSVFVVFLQPTVSKENKEGKNWWQMKTVQTINGPWNVSFDPKAGGPAKPVVFKELTDWSTHSDSGIHYYSGTARYSKTFNWKAVSNVQHIWLDLGKVANIAEVKVNGKPCGVAWVAPYRVDITHALKQGANQVEVEVTNTWANRMIGDHHLPEDKRITNTISPFVLEGKPLLPAGLSGPVTITVAE